MTVKEQLIIIALAFILAGVLILITGCADLQRDLCVRTKPFKECQQ